jgi:hypothetical protein
MADIAMQEWRSNNTPQRIELTRMYSVLVEGTIGKQVEDMHPNHQGTYRH